MSGRHRARPTKKNVIAASILASVGISSVVSAAVVAWMPSDETDDAVSPAAPTQPLSQQGRLIAVSADSITTQGVDGSVQTFVVTPQTTTVGSRTVSQATPFAVNDEVEVVGTRQDGALVATAIAARSATDLQGRPMDYGL
jgi:hypothetical protein